MSLMNEKRYLDSVPRGTILTSEKIHWVQNMFHVEHMLLNFVPTLNRTSLSLIVPRGTIIISIKR